MQLRTISPTKNLMGKRVLVRIDANVPIQKGRAIDGPNGKIAQASVGLEWLLQRGAKVIVLAHLGRPNGRKVGVYSLAPIAKRLSELLHTKVFLSPQIIGPQVETYIEGMQKGSVLLLENLRFKKGEQENSKTFAMALAQMGDLYVNDAFGNCHRNHASVDAITEELPAFAGPLVQKEVRLLEQIREHPKHPCLLVLGGRKMMTKLPLLESLLPKVDYLLLGGALAHPFLRAKGLFLGKSVFEKTEVPLAKKLLKKFGEKIILPVDVIVASRLAARTKKRSVSIQEITENDFIVDLGEQTIKFYGSFFQNARTIIWNGPFGYCEVGAFCEGTFSLARMIAAQTGKAKTIVGGGDTLPYVEAAGVVDKFSLLSTGGGAMLDFLTGKKFPALEALKK